MCSCAGDPLGRPIGDPLFHPIYEAAAEMELCISVHPTVVDRPNSTVLAVGGTKGYIEYVAGFSQQAMHSSRA